MKKTFILAGGGTGGHLFPALAVAQSLKNLEPGCEIIFVGTSQGLEVKYVPEAGYHLYLLPVGKLNLQGQWFEKFKTLLRLPWAFLRSAQILIRHSPYAVLGVGGYASGPFVLMASVLGYRTALWEPNALPGLTNRWLSRFVDHCYIVFDQAKEHLGEKKSQRLGIPLRAEIEKAAGVFSDPPKNAAARPFRIFCFGGSQGSRVINNTFFEVLKELPPGQFEVVHQIGSTDWKVFEDKYKNFGSWVKPLKFIDDMANKYQWADLVISRAGASTVAELAAFGKTSILIPLPGADAHQEKNAISIAQKSAGVCILQRDLNPTILKEQILRLSANPTERQAMGQAIQKFFEPKASEKIASALMEIMG